MEQLSLFDNREKTAPLASRLRPGTLEDYVGQKHLIGKGKILSCCGPNQNDTAFLHKWKKSILLRLVKTVNLICKQQGGCKDSTEYVGNGCL